MSASFSVHSAGILCLREPTSDAVGDAAQRDSDCVSQHTQPPAYTTGQEQQHTVPTCYQCYRDDSLQEHSPAGLWEPKLRGRELDCEAASR